MKKSYLGNRGFGLMELMISSAIVMGIALVIVATLRMGHRSMMIGETSRSASFEVRRGINRMSREITETSSNRIIAPATGAIGNTITFQVPEDVNNDGSVLDNLGALEWSPAITYALGGVDGDQVIRTQAGLANQVIATGVTALQFDRTASDIVDISFTVQKGANRGGFVQQVQMDTQVRVRN